MSVKRIVQSVQSCKFDEATCSAVESLASTNLEAGLAILEELENSQLNNQSETFSSAQVAVYLTYIYRFMLAYGQDRIPPSYKTTVCQYLDTKDSDLAVVIVLIGKSTMAKDSEICEFVFRYHFQNRENPLALRLLTAFADHDGKAFFKKLEEYLLDKSTQFYSLELLGKVVTNQGSHLHLITETQCFNTLLALLETEETLLVVLSLAIRILAMLLPFIPTSLPPLLDRLLALVAKLTLLAWKTTHQPLSFQVTKDFKENQQIGISVGLLVVYIYGMFPCSFLDFIRTQEDKRIRNAIKPLMNKMAFNPGLLSAKGNEMSIDRWKRRDPHDIVAECMGLTRGNDAVGQDTEITEYLKQQLIAQQKILASHDNSKEPHPTAQDRFYNAVNKQEKMWLQYLLHQYQSRAANLGRELMLARARADEAQSFTSRIGLLEGEIASLHAHIQTLNKEHTSALAQELAYNRDTMETFRKLKEEKEELQERCGSLLFDATQLATSRQDLVAELNDKSERLTQLQVQFADACDELTQLESDNAKIRSLNDDLLVWKDQQTTKAGDRRDIQMLQEEIAQRDESITDLVEQLEIANAQISTLHENYQSGLVLLQQLEQEKAQWQEQLTFARNEIEKQRMVDAAKLKSVEEKYSSVKSLYLGVEKRILELRSENDKARR